MAEKQINTRLIVTVSVLLALLFGAIGVMLLINPKQFVVPRADPEQITLFLLRGLGAAFCVGAFLLLVPRVAWVGAVVLAVVLIGVICKWAIQGDVQQTIIPALFLVSLASLAYVRRPRTLTVEPPKNNAAPVALAGPTARAAVPGQSERSAV
jgi:hypothetical protein